MRIENVLAACIIGMALTAAASAEIYQSKDAQGNTVYSDKPSQGAQPVNLPKTNAADPVVEMPRPAATTEPPAPGKVAAKPAKPVQRAKDVNNDNLHDDYYYDGYNYNGNNDDSDHPRKDRRRDNDAKPDRDRPVKVQPLPSRPSRPAVGGGGRR
jgi:hypothetical protein